ncbi:Pre-mRNA-splicing factor cwc24 [Penicillium macrosclerotiorum]|uniref:Pre-mRNA-splicing factor cwc24 n=1 Tax=Penicillium macrosclerotiorum TaxID=303699 RepID=UPI0025488CA3|nr:Pre-mRNA-splicing factor cwc24 [Penicillium macrosclerotiorum]KAJ5688966.1 Pre-mRNA-splicing factor cwc24 [Penicillium macrosclerotiorum]
MLSRIGLVISGDFESLLDRGMLDLRASNHCAQLSPALLYHQTPPDMADETSTLDAVPQFGFKKRAKGKASFRKKPATPPPASDSGSDFTSSDDEAGRRIKRRKNVSVTASSLANATTKTTNEEPASVGPVAITSSNDATKQSNWYDEEDLSAKNLLGSTRARPQPSASATSVSTSDGTYKGAANYQSFIQKNPDAPTKQFGPVKAPTNIRTVTTIDFAPDVCKDYKQTGYCGFGDSCIYLHERTDYKQGWELDREWEVETKGKKQAGRVVSQRKGAGHMAEGDDDDDDELLENIPFACIICRKPYQTPIITKCGHYFCEACALQRYRKNPSCAACGAGTGGVFNTAKKLNVFLDKKRERARKRREKAIAEGKDVSEEEEEKDGSD